MHGVQELYASILVHTCRKGKSGCTANHLPQHSVSFTKNHFTTDRLTVDIYQMRLTRNIRNSIIDGKFPQFVQKFISTHYPQGAPQWSLDALADAGIVIPNKESST